MYMAPRLTLKTTEVTMALRVQTDVQIHASLLKVLIFRLQTCDNDPILLFKPFHLQNVRQLVPPSGMFKRDDQF